VNNRLINHEIEKSKKRTWLVLWMGSRLMTGNMPMKPKPVLGLQNYGLN
jgi:hypothetical protein